MTLTDVQTISTVILNMVLITAAIYAINTIWNIRSWYEKTLKELDDIENRIVDASARKIKRDAKNINSVGLFSSDELNKKHDEKIEKVLNGELELLREKRRFILDRVPFVDLLKSK